MFSYNCKSPQTFDLLCPISRINFNFINEFSSIYVRMACISALSNYWILELPRHWYQVAGKKKAYWFIRNNGISLCWWHPHFPWWGNKQLSCKTKPQKISKIGRRAIRIVQAPDEISTVEDSICWQPDPSTLKASIITGAFLQKPRNIIVDLLYTSEQMEEFHKAYNF